MAQVYNTTSTGGGFLAYDFITYLGSSAGICGLYGLMLVCLIRMGKANPNNNSAWLEHVTVAMNLGGYVGGLLLGMLCGPGYTKDYRMTRKNSVGYDPVDREYRAVMGFGILPTARGWLPVPVLQAILLTIFLVVPHYRSIRGDHERSVESSIREKDNEKMDWIASCWMLDGIDLPVQLYTSSSKRSWILLLVSYLFILNLLVIF